MKHRMKFGIDESGVFLEAVDCPADHGGTCDHVTVEEVGTPDCWAWIDDTDEERAAAAAHFATCEACQLYDEHGTMQPVDGCWSKEFLGDFLYEQDMGLPGAIGYDRRKWVSPWLEFSMRGPGPECDEDIEIDLEPAADPEYVRRLEEALLEAFGRIDALSESLLSPAARRTHVEVVSRRFGRIHDRLKEVEA